MNFPVFDLHCDTVLNILGRDLQGSGSLRKNEGHIDLERAKTLPGYAQCFACFTSPLHKLPAGMSQIQLFERELAAIQRELYRSRDLIAQAYTAEDVRQNLANGMMSAVLTIEGPAGFDYDPALLEDLYKIGFRITTLGWNERNPLTGSHITGGVAGYNQCAEFTGEQPDLDTVCDHILHFLELDPDGLHIALGGDLDGIDEMPAGFTGVQDYPKLAQKLLERGVDAQTVRQIFWDNALGVMDRCCM